MEDLTLSRSARAAGVAAATDVRSAADNAGELLDAILRSLKKDKAEAMVTIALAGKSEMADHMVICSGRSSRQVAAIAEKLGERLKRDRGVVCRFEGKEQGDWVLVDAGDVIVHVFRPEVREFYQLEKMWADAGGVTGTGRAGS